MLAVNEKHPTRRSGASHKQFAFFGLIAAWAIEPLVYYQGLTSSNCCLGSNKYLPCDLPVAFPVGDLIGDQRIILCGLDIAVRIDGTRGDGMFTRLGIIPLQRPEAPSKTANLFSVKLRS